MIVRLELVLLIEEEQGEPMHDSNLLDLSTPLTARAYIKTKVRLTTTVTIP